MVIVVVCDLNGGFLKINDNDAVQLISIQKLQCQDIEKIDNFYITLRQKVSKFINYFNVLLDSSYKNDFRKNLIEIGNKYNVQNISIIGINQALLLKAIQEIPVAVNLNDVLAIFSQRKNQICCTIWKQVENIGWKFITNLKEEKSLGKNATVKAFQVLATKIKNLHRPIFVMIYNKNLKPSNMALSLKQKKPINFAEIILENEQEQILNLFRSCKHVNFQLELEKSECALLHALNPALLEDVKYKHQIITEKDVELKFDKKTILKIMKWQCLPFTKTIFVETDESDMLVIFENDAYSYNIRVQKHVSLKIEVNINSNSIYNIALTNVTEKTIEELKSILDSNDEKSNFSQLPQASEYLLQKTDFVILSKSIDYNPNFNAIGIDLGTTECCAAVIRKNGPDFVVLDQTSNLRTMPSYVAFDEKEPKFGKIALDRMRYKSEYTVYDSKRIIGKDFERIAIDPLWPFEVLIKERNVFLQMKTYNNDILQKRPEEISAALLLHIKNMLEQYQGNNLIEAVITIPSEYSEKQKHATKIAAEMSGFQTIHFIPEPVAAAFAYFTEINIPNLSNILICDCGGGTTDVCVARVDNNIMQVLSFDGDSLLGGRDFDKVLYNHFNAILKHQHKINIKESNRKYILSQKCQDIKHNLSTTFDDWLHVDNFKCDSNDIVPVNREEFEELSAPLLLRIKNVILNAISKASLHCNDINYVFQVGGGCRMPMIKKLLADLIPNAINQCSLYPDWVVAHGAALYAYHLKERNN